MLKTDSQNQTEITDKDLTRIYISGTDIYPQMPILCPHTMRFHEGHISTVTFTWAHLYSNVYMWVGVVQFWASGRAKFTKMGDTLPRTRLNHRAKFDTASFILGGEICNRRNKQTNTHKNSKRYIHTLPVGVCG